MPPSPTFDTILLDYGHGGLHPETGEYLTPGAKQYTFTDHHRMFIGEGVSNRETAWRLAQLLAAQGVRVYDVVGDQDLGANTVFSTLEQSDVPLVTRVERANRHDPSSSLFVSLHSNATGSTLAGASQSTRGGGIWTSKGQTRSDAVATTVYDAFMHMFAYEPVYMLKGQAQHDGDPDREANFYVLQKTRMPAILGEILFFTNIDDAMYLLSPHGQDVIAGAYLAGLRPWLKTR